MATVLWRCLVKIFILCSFYLYLVQGKSNLIILDEDNWDSMLTGEWMVEFYAPWCPACKALQPLWEDFSGWSKDLSISVGQVDVTASPGLSGRFIVTALPTIFHVIEGEFRQYKGSRDRDAFISFIEERKWKRLEAVPSWKSPASIQMSIVSYFFRLSQVLRAVHTRLMEEYGLPTWGSYLIFAVATIFLGALLGLVVVCIIDFFYPPKSIPIPVSRTTSEKADSGGETDDDLAEEEIVDESSSGERSPVRKRKSRKDD